MDVLSPSSFAEEALSWVQPQAFETFVHLLRWRSEHTPHRMALTFSASGDEVQSFTYAELDQAARAVATGLQAQNCVGARAVILLQPSADYVLALLGCWYARVTAVPVYSPRKNVSNDRVRSILEDAGARVVMSTASVLKELDTLQWAVGGSGPMVHVPVDRVDLQSAGSWTESNVNGNTLAVLQYTSGSTGAPKGVRLQHRHLMKNSEMIHQAMDTKESDVAVVWLPPYHDMGLIGGILQPLFGGYPVHLMAPATFLQRPLRWLETISLYKGTVSAAPNFAYDLCTKRIKPEQLAQLDLSSWRLAANGAEPIRKATLDAFQAAFSPAGFSPSAFFPCYGMAETTLLIAAPDPHLPYVHLPVDRQALKNGQLMTGGDDTVDLVSSGVPAQDVSLCIVDPKTRQPLADGFVGEIWVAGPMVADGYWNNPEATQETFYAYLDNGIQPWLRTGDLGAVLERQVYVTGRIKDLIIIAGHNHYPSDIEATVMNAHCAVRAHGVAAFAVEDEGEERLALVVELDKGWRDLDLSIVRETIVAQVSLHHQLRVHALTFTSINSVAKTSSGKIQRGQTRDLLERGLIQPLSQRDES
ncbi:fatty acyl-AMP ligase [Pseudomonas viridiflava]|uniref:fatty acyl-AMP ligase n=1 Tax=Pseudomonas viridiflava TaxID=33069 RepID=UPI002EC5A0A9|nr:fatty acyl-AMP ligase [Pseudomonas viridiflava]